MQKGVLALASSIGPTKVSGAIATGTGPDIPWFRLFLALAFSLLIAWGAISLLRRRRALGSAKLAKWLPVGPGIRIARRVQVLETRRASSHGDLCLVEVDSQVFFLAITPGGATILDRRPAVGTSAQ